MMKEFENEWVLANSKKAKEDYLNEGRELLKKRNQELSLVDDDKKEHIIIQTQKKDVNVPFRFMR